MVPKSRRYFAASAHKVCVSGRKLRIMEGRMFQPSVNELIVGKAAKAQYKDMDIGSHITTRTATWIVVGTFTSRR